MIKSLHEQLALPQRYTQYMENNFFCQEDFSRSRFGKYDNKVPILLRKAFARLHFRRHNRDLRKVCRRAVFHR